MSNDRNKEAHERAVGYITKYLKMVDGFEEGLLKTHEFLGYVRDVADEVGNAAQDAVMTLSEKVAKYRDEVWERVAAGEAKVYGDVTPEQFTGKYAAKPKDVLKMTRNEKVQFIIDGYGLNDTDEQREAIEKASDESLNSAVRMIQNREQRHK